MPIRLPPSTPKSRAQVEPTLAEANVREVKIPKGKTKRQIAGVAATQTLFGQFYLPSAGTPPVKVARDGKEFQVSAVGLDVDDVAFGGSLFTFSKDGGNVFAPPADVTQPRYFDFGNYNGNSSPSASPSNLFSFKPAGQELLRSPSDRFK